MAVDMSNVKQIMHNNKEVIKIEDSNGDIIWESQSEYPFRRLEYLKFDGTVFTRSGEYNANNRAYRLIYAQTGWASNNLCFPFGIYTSTQPKNVLLIRNQLTNNVGFETCRVGDTRFGTAAATTYMNTRMVAEMRWGTTTTVYYRLHKYISTSFIFNGSGTASGRTGTNTGYFFIGAINDGGGNQPSNANGLLVGNIYEVAVAGSNSFDNYTYYYVPCQRKSDGAIGFKQPHRNDSFYPLIVKSTGEEVKNNSAYMGPVVDEYWDGTTYISM